MLKINKDYKKPKELETPNFSKESKDWLESAFDDMVNEMIYYNIREMTEKYLL